MGAINFTHPPRGNSARNNERETIWEKLRYLSAHANPFPPLDAPRTLSLEWLMQNRVYEVSCRFFFVIAVVAQP